LKYDILKHPNVKLTTDGRASAYEHKKVNIHSVDNIQKYYKDLKTEINDYEFISSHEMDIYLKERID